MTEAARHFFGVPIPSAIAGDLLPSVEWVTRRAPMVRLVSPENWHLTIRFLGDLTPAQRGAVQTEFAAALLPPAFRIRVQGWGGFPKSDRARVFWAGIEDPDGGLASLNRAAERAAVAAGLEPEGRPFSPHLTLGRLRFPGDLRPTLEALPGIDIEMAVDACVLYRSVFHGGGVRYDAVGTSGQKRIQLTANS